MDYLVISQEMPAPQPVPPAQPAPGAAPAAAPPPAGAPPAPGAAPPPEAAPAKGAVSMGTMLQWAALGGAASGAIQAILGLVSGFDVMGFLMTVLIAVVLGILVAMLLGQFGAKIPLKATLMVKAALFMFVLNLLAGLIFGMGEGALGLILGIIGIGAGAFAYGYLIQNKLPGLI